MKQRLKMYGLLLILLITSCTNTPTSNSEPSNNNNQTSSHSSETSNHSSQTSTSTSLGSSSSHSSLTTSDSLTSSSSSSTSENEAILNEVKSFQSNSVSYGNTNGNANNNGLAVFDHKNKLHYFAIGRRVYSFDPLTNITTTLFSYGLTGHIQNLCLLGADLYFVTTESNFLYRFNLDDQIVYIVYEEETNKVYGYFNTIFANIKRLDPYDEMAFGLATYNHGRKETTTKFSLGATLVNVDGTRLYYSQDNGVELKLMADAFNGKTNIYHFSPDVFDEMTAIHLFSASFTSPSILRFALLLKGGTTTALYLYSSDDNSLIKISEASNIHSINSDGEYIYFISGNSLHRYDVSANHLEEPLYLYQNVKHIFVINHWLYFSNDNLTSLYRIHPITKIISTDFWL